MAKSLYRALRVGKGDIVKNPDPEPNYIPIFQVTVEKSIQHSRYLRYKAWDFNKDGLFDMLEELDPEGKTVSRNYDFNFDGVEDFSESA